MEKSKTAGQQIQRLRDARKMRGISQRELAKAAGLSQSAIGNIESGRRELGEIGLKVAQALGVDPHWLSTGEGTMQIARPATEKITSAQRSAKRIAVLEAKLKQARERLQKRKTADRRREQAAARKIEMRKYLLLGTYVREKMPEYLCSEEFKNSLKTDADRALFGLGPVNASQ